MVGMPLHHNCYLQGICSWYKSEQFWGHFNFMQWDLFCTHVAAGLGECRHNPEAIFIQRPLTFNLYPTSSEDFYSVSSPCSHSTSCIGEVPLQSDIYFYPSLVCSLPFEGSKFIIIFEFIITFFFCFGSLCFLLYELTEVPEHRTAQGSPRPASPILCIHRQSFSQSF